MTARRLVAMAAVAAAAFGCGTPSSSSPAGGRPSGSAGTSAAGRSAPPATPGAPAVSAPGDTPVTTSPAAAGNWLTYGRDAARSGVAPAPPATHLVRAWADSVDGDVLAEPLVADGEVVVATEHDTVEALDATTGRIRWSRHLGSPVAGSQLPCGDIDPSGITGTPVIDPAIATVWVVAFVDQGGRPGHQLVGLDLASGVVRSVRAADLPGADPAVEQQRGALTLDGGRVVIAYGGLYGDCGDYHGALVSLPEAGNGSLGSWTVPAAREGGIWAPGGPVEAPDGSLLVSTGNTVSTSGFDDANAVVRLSAGLRPVDLWAPANWAGLSASDTDEGSTAPALLAGGLVVTVGKAGTGYLLRESHLGGIGGELTGAAVCPGSGAYGGTAAVGAVVYEPCRDGLRAVQAGPGPVLRVLWKAPGTFPGAPVIAAGLVWFADRGGTVRGLEPETGHVEQQAEAGPGASAFASAAASGRWLYVPAGDQVVGFSGL